ncbi:xylose isomerase domain-containing protein [Halosimplex carlsbadense 2-9-1]|uniref:Xylose isomerase domain-containing protein n=1 Tax=Halosimplex carlsbadense 2-9-1 TaxID=797114 RepID=M0CSP7_9EURY|nr:sugar phosphate isomerase/epimerase [Halosimplex carlsbadense]ELZ24894.1 xylose isomerase domain-containing protein [Halosimplex carlsbadense 2-9-1]
MPRDYDIGVQSVVFRDFSLADLLSELDGTDVTHLELWGHHLAPDHDDGTVAAGLDAVAAAEVSVCGYGVADLESPEEARDHAAFADRLGADYLTVNYPPAADAITEELIDLAEEFDLDVGIHNYSSVHHDDLSRVFSTIDDVRGVLDRYDHDRLGLCIDTGHFLVEDVRPEDVVREFGDRINSCHLKDTSDAEIEDVPGAGQLDVASFVGLLDDHADLTAPLVIEYELPQDRATEALREAVETVQAALDD